MVIYYGNNNAKNDGGLKSSEAIVTIVSAMKAKILFTF